MVTDRSIVLGLRTHLQASVEVLPDEVVNRLAQARQQALAQWDRTSPRTRAWQSSVGASWLSVALVVALFGVGQYWNQTVLLERQGAVDTALLSDDLPIEAYLDPEFRAWVQQNLGS